MLATTGVILAAVYMLSLVQKMFFGPLSNPKNANLPDLNVRETLALAPLIALIFVLGFFPNVFLDRARDSVATVIEGYQEGRKAYMGMEPGAAAKLRPRKGGNLETGYPEPPKPGGDAAKKDPAPTAQLDPARPAGGAP